MRGKLLFLLVVLGALAWVGVAQDEEDAPETRKMDVEKEEYEEEEEKEEEEEEEEEEEGGDIGDLGGTRVVQDNEGPDTQPEPVKSTTMAGPKPITVIRHVICREKRKCARENGRCMKQCESDEREIENGCSGDNGCKCCVHIDCHAKQKCLDYDGHCKKTCDHDEFIVRKGCHGDSKKKCRCCSKKDGCWPTNKCKRHHGHCSEASCASNEVEITHGCNGKSCHCCADYAKLADIYADMDFDDYPDNVEDYYQ